MLAAHSPGLTSGGFRGWSPGYAEQSEQSEQLSFCALHCLGRSQIRLRVSRRLQCRQRHALLQSLDQEDWQIPGLIHEAQGAEIARRFN